MKKIIIIILLSLLIIPTVKYKELNNIILVNELKINCNKNNITSTIIEIIPIAMQ